MSGEVSGFNAAVYETKDGSYGDLRRVTAVNAVTGMTSLFECNAAWRRFKELTKGHRGRLAKTYIMEQVTADMNYEGLGIESPPLTSRRKTSSSLFARDWDAPSLDMDHILQSGLEKHGRFVATLAYEDEDGGLNDVQGGPVAHREGTCDAMQVMVDREDDCETFPGGPASNVGRQSSVSSLSFQRPYWWPSTETMESTKAKLDNLAGVCRRLGMRVPSTLEAALSSAVELASEAVKRHAARAIESPIEALKTDNDMLRKKIESLSKTVSDLNGKAAHYKAESAQLMSDAKERDIHVPDLKTQIDDLTRENQILKNQAAATLAGVRKAKDNVKLLMANHDLKLRGVQDRLDNAVKDFQTIRDEGVTQANVAKEVDRTLASLRMP